MRWFFTCDPAGRMICPICKTYYTSTPLDTLEKVSPTPPALLQSIGHPVTSILIFHYIFSFIAVLGANNSLPVGEIYFAAILCYQAVYFGLLLNHVRPRHPWTYARAYWVRKNWSLPVFQVATLCFLGYNPQTFFIAGACANGLLHFYWPAHVETILECNAMELDNLAIRLTLMDDS